MTKEDIELWHTVHPYEDRTPEYMDAVLAHVKELWKKYPQMRLGRLVCNLGYADPFHTLDEHWANDNS